ncbi:MAG: hypothetical protein IJ715_05515 [Bacilli bacterium]|nr:hypothetical protein [Bacilli bacterium]
MDNKDFDEVEDIFGTDLEENYDVPVFEQQFNSEDTINNEETSTFDDNEIKEEVPVYNDNTEFDYSPVIEENNNASTEDKEVDDDLVNNQVTSYETDSVASVEPEPNYETNEEINYGPVAPEVNYEEEIIEHPDAVVSLNNKEEVENKEKSDDVTPVNLKDNKSLKFVFVVGIIILVAIFLLPYINKLGI